MNAMVIFLMAIFPFGKCNPTDAEKNGKAKNYVNQSVTDSIPFKTNKMSPTENEVLAVVKAWNDCFSSNDAAAYFTHIHEQLTLFIPSSPYRIDGKQDDQEEFEWSLSRGRTKVHFFQELQPLVQVYGNTAVVTYHNRLVAGPDDTGPMYFLKETNVLVKENGAWKIVHIHVSK